VLTGRRWTGLFGRFKRLLIIGLGTDSLEKEIRVLRLRDPNDNRGPDQSLRKFDD
jgi:hypothetical protein